MSKKKKINNEKNQLTMIMICNERSVRTLNKTCSSRKIINYYFKILNLKKLDLSSQKKLKLYGKG